jgi:hypothetical protein
MIKHKPKPIRYSDDVLSPDEGKVFVTDVPGAKFQVVGRRHPKTGELLLRGKVSDLKKLPNVIKAIGGSLEIVTGREAEDFLARVEADKSILADEAARDVAEAEYLKQKLSEIKNAPGSIDEVAERYRLSSELVYKIKNNKPIFD